MQAWKRRRLGLGGGLSDRAARLATDLRVRAAALDADRFGRGVPAPSPALIAFVDDVRDTSGLRGQRQLAGFDIAVARSAELREQARALDTYAQQLRATGSPYRLSRQDLAGCAAIFGVLAMMGGAALYLDAKRGGEHGPWFFAGVGSFALIAAGIVIAVLMQREKA